MVECYVGWEVSTEGNLLERGRLYIYICILELNVSLEGSGAYPDLGNHCCPFKESGGCVGKCLGLSIRRKVYFCLLKAIYHGDKHPLS